MTRLTSVSSMNSGLQKVHLYDNTVMKIAEMNKMSCWLCNKLIIYFLCRQDAVKCSKYQAEFHTPVFFCQFLSEMPE